MVRFATGGRGKITGSPPFIIHRRHTPPSRQLLLLLAHESALLVQTDDLDVLEAWGAAYSFVFEMLGYALFGLGGVVAGTGAMKKRTASVEVGTTAAEKRTHVGL